MKRFHGYVTQGCWVLQKTTKRTWTKHFTELKINFVNKLNLLRKCSFLTKKSLLDLYFKTMLPSVTYGITLWGNCNNCDHIKSLQALHCRAGRISFNFPWDTPSKTVMEVTQWDSVYEMYKLSLMKFFYNIVCDNTPYLIQNLVTWRESPYDLRGNNKAVVPRFSTNSMKHSIQYRGAVPWNFFPIILLTFVILNIFPVKWKGIPYLRSLILTVYQFSRYPRDYLIIKFKLFNLWIFM